MEEEILVSLRIYLDEVVERATQVLVMRDGLSLSKATKPFITIGYIVTNSSLDAAGRTNYSETYRYQVSLFETSNSALMQLQDAVATALRDADGIPVRDTKGVLMNQNVLVDISEFTPLPNDDTANDTYNNHGTFVVSTEIYRDNGSKTFTQ